MRSASQHFHLQLRHPVRQCLHNLAHTVQHSAFRVLKGVLEMARCCHQYASQTVDSLIQQVWIYIPDPHLDISEASSMAPWGC